MILATVEVQFRFGEYNGCDLRGSLRAVTTLPSLLECHSCFTKLFDVYLGIGMVNPLLSFVGLGDLKGGPPDQ